MNAQRREQIEALIEKLNKLKEEELDSILSDEQDYYDGIPENLMGSERAETSQEAIRELEDAQNSLDDVISSLGSAKGD